MEMNNDKTNIPVDIGRPRMLPIVCFEGEVYFADHQLRELRKVDDLFKRLAFSDPKASAFLKPYRFIRCPTCDQTKAVLREFPEKGFRCIRCGQDVVLG
jgi:hypothetical protein